MRWKTVQIGDVCEIVSGATPKTGNPTFWDGDVRWVTPKDLSSSEGKFISDSTRRITDAGLKSCAAKLLPANSILLSSRAPIGLVAINTIQLCTNQGFKNLVPRDNNIYADYLFWWLATHRDYLDSLGRGATFKEISKAIVERIEIPLPPLEEQKRIAAILDAADELRTKRRESLAQLDTLLQSTFLDLFGDPVTNPKGWETVPFSETGTFVSGATPSKSRKDFWDGNIPWVSPKDMKVDRIKDSIDHISEAAFLETNLKRLEEPHLLIVVRGMILAHSFPTAINDVAIAINQDMKGILPSLRFDVVFLKSCMDNLRRQILSNVSTAGHGTKRLDAEVMRKIEVLCPPKARQEEFGKLVEEMTCQRARYGLQLTELDTLFASLQARAFRGELR